MVDKIEPIKLIKCSNCGREVEINDPKSLIKLAEIIKDTNENINCCDNPNYAPFSKNNDNK